MPRHIYSDAEDKPTSDENADAFDALWHKPCSVCSASPVVRAVGLCGPCTWGESAMALGAWVDE